MKFKIFNLRQNKTFNKYVFLHYFKQIRRIFRQKFLILLLITNSAWANVLGTDAQNFNPVNDGLDFVTVHSSQSLDAGNVNLGLFLNMASNTLPLLAAYSSQTLTKSHDRLYSLDFNMGYGFTPNWEIGLSAPYLLSQESSHCDACGLFTQTGFTETRAYVKNGNYKIGSFGFAWVLSGSKNAIEDNPFAGRNSGPTSTLEIAMDHPLGHALLGFNIGHRWRQPGEKIPLLNDAFGRVTNQLIYSVALSRYVDDWNSNFIWEIFGSQPTEKNLDGVNGSDRSDRSLETLVGFKHMWSHQLALHSGAGTEITHGFGTPDLRLYAGLNYAFGTKEKAMVESITNPPSGVSNDETGEVEKTFVLLNLKFEFDSTTLTRDSLDVYEKFVKDISEEMNLTRIVVEGHTDSIGNPEYNSKLSQKRADYLKGEIEKALNKRKTSIRLESFGYGSSQPLASNSNFQGRAKNRRVIVRTFSKKLK